jgi:hypothetical protein
MTNVLFILLGAGDLAYYKVLHSNLGLSTLAMVLVGSKAGCLKRIFGSRVKERRVLLKQKVIGLGCQLFDTFM